MAPSSRPFPLGQRIGPGQGIGLGHQIGIMAAIALAGGGIAAGTACARTPQTIAGAPVAGGAPIGEALASSTPRQLALVEHLRRRGALFYGAWWCPACFKQKNLFGRQAGDRLPYVECDKSEAGRQRCQAAGIRAFPTWVMGNSRLEGVQTIEELKSWSGFGG